MGKRRMKGRGGDISEREKVKQDVGGGREEVKKLNVGRKLRETEYSKGKGGSRMLAEKKETR